MPDPSPLSEQSDHGPLVEFREWSGRGWEATDDEIRALFERADAHIAAGGQGGRYWLVDRWLRMAADPENFRG